jgi:AcrR family transcriptional regulator
VSKSLGILDVMHPASSTARKRASFDELLLAGIEAIAAKGIDQVNVTDVTSIAKVSRPTFYTYFGDMNGFYAEIWLHHGRHWLDAQYDETLAIDSKNDQALLEIFAVSRRIPELIEVVQPEFERWWAENVGNDARRGQNASWLLGARIGLKISRPVSSKGALGLPIFSYLQIDEDEFSGPLMQGLGQVPSPLPAMPGIRYSEANVEQNLTHAAIEVIAKSGVAAASMTRIARRARVSTGTLYPRFKSVGALIESSFAQAIRDIVSGNVVMIEAQGTGVDQYGLAVNAGFLPDREVWRNYRIEMHLAAAHDQRLAKMMEPGFEETAKLLEDSAVRMGVSRDFAIMLAWFMHVHAIGISLLFAVMPAVSEQDNRYMTRHMGALLRSAQQLG